MTETTPQPSQPLLDRTHELLNQSIADGIRIKDITRLSRGHLEYEWIRKFHRGEIADPSVRRTQMLHDLLQHMAALPEWIPPKGISAMPPGGSTEQVE